MKIHNIKYLHKLLAIMTLVFSSSFSLLYAQQSDDLAVMHMQSKGKYNRIFNSNTNLKKLLDIGSNNKATIEFWAMHNTHSSTSSTPIDWSITNFENEDKTFSLKVKENEIVLQVGKKSFKQSLLLGDKLFKNTWYHYTITVDASVKELRIYINGVEVLFNTPQNLNVEELYIISDSKTDLFLAEYRAWSTTKTKEQIQLQQYRSFYKENKNSLTELKNNGLQVVYTNTNQKNEDSFGNNTLTTTSWSNLLYSYFPEDNLVKSANFTSSYKNTGLALISSVIAHPILNLDKIIVRASDGDGNNNTLLSGANGVIVKWLHTKGTDEYQVLRRNIRASTSSIVIHTQNNVSTKQPSEEIRYVDKNILPNELYEYTIQAKKEGVSTLSGKDVGFVLPNGKVSGLIQTSSRVATKLAKVEAISKSGTNPGGALQIEKNTNPILVKNIEAFRKGTTGGTFEFWYKTPTIADGENKIVTVGNGELIIDKNNVKVKVNNEIYVEGARTTDANWHHYAFTYSGKGAMLFEDGVLLTSTTNLYRVDLSSTNFFSLAAKTEVIYNLDEVRFWNVSKTSLEINKYANHIIGGKVADLFAYYRFDFNDKHKLYNFSSDRRGQYIAESEGVLKHISASEQPNITYATYTNETGNYEFTSLNTGIQGQTNNDNKLEYTIKPSKPRFQFLPATKLASVPRKLNGAEVTNVNFTDVSSLPVTGVISYRVDNQLFPVLKGTALMVDGTVIKSSEATKVTTDDTGTYAIKTAPGKRIITPNPKPILTNEERLNEGSLKFDGKTGYAESVQNITNNGNSFTWSGFIKPYLKKTAADKVPIIQTILQWGNLSLKLIDNTTLKVYTGTQEKLSESIPTSNQGRFAFFGISYDKAKGVISLYVNNRKKNTSLSSLTINTPVIIGSEKNAGKYSNYSKSNLDLLEYRTTALEETNITKLREGKYIAPEVSKLALSYTFDQKYGTKAINVSVANERNNYLQFTGDCRFDNTTHKQYIRSIEYTYKATNATFNPKGSSYEVVLEEPLQNLNFENTTRRSFIGNIVVPCNNNVGNWTGKIVRTDIKFPKFEKSISIANFNSNQTVFTINDLLPGQYRVELTNVNSNRKLQSPTIDLRRKNIIYDFEFRNNIEIEIELAGYDEIGLRDSNLSNFNYYKQPEIPKTCDGKYVVKSSDGFFMSVKVFERYGANKCTVQNASVTLGGDALLINNNLKFKTNSIGSANFISQFSEPNFLGDHTRNFLISVEHQGRTTSVSNPVIITGAKQGNADFTLIDPQVGFVLHDPPGDNSFATLTKGATFSKTTETQNGVETDTSFDIGIAANFTAEMFTGAIVQAFGIGVLTGFVTPAANLKSENEVLIGGSFQYAKHKSNSYSVTLEKSISTPSDPTYVGEDADVFIGISRTLTFGTGRVLKVNGCTPIVQNSNKVAKPTTFSPFTYTKQSLEDNIIPNLYRLAIAKYDKNNDIVTPPKDRDHLDLVGTLEKLLAKSSRDNEDKDIKNYIHQITSWRKIIDDNHNKLQAAAFNAAPDFSTTTKKLNNTNNLGGNSVGINPSILDKRIAFDALTEITYTLSRARDKSTGNQFSGAPFIGARTSNQITAFGAGITLNNETRVSSYNSTLTTGGNENNRVDSFTLKDDDAGDQFDVSIRRDPQYDTPMFLTNAGRSSCPFESGTVPREGVEIIIDKVVGYGAGDESILYNITLRNTQIAKDATRKSYTIAMAGASNSLGAVVNLNESPIFEPTTSYPIVFDLDPNSPTGVAQEVKAQLRIARGTGAPSEISYKNIKIQAYSDCEQAGDRYRSYGVDEYAEVGVKPYDEVLVTAHFTGVCIETVTADAPQNDWVVNGSDKKKLDFKFRIPELKGKPNTDDFSVDLEYTIKGNNTPRILKKINLQKLKEHLNTETDFVEYSADVSSLTNGEYSFRIVPVCGDGGSDNPNNRKTPTPFVKGKIARNAPKLVLTTPDNGGIHTTGTISAKFSAAINPATVNLNSLAMRGILGGVPKPLTSVKLDNVNDLITIPHDSRFNLEEKATIEMWVNPAKYPTSGNVPILQKGNNYAILLASDGKIDLGNGVKSSVGLQSFTWTHVAVVADKVNGNVTIYFNGNPVGSGRISTILKTNEDPIVIAPVVNNDAFVGSLDEIRLWRSLRTPAQLVSKMRNQLLGNEDTLEAYFVFNNNTLAKQGINGKPNEAIQDFTGNASGTTANSIEFVTSEEAAPLDQTKTVDDIQFTTTMSENNTIINFEMKISDLEFVEGARLTVFVKDKKLEDPLGNKVDKTSWSFIIDRSKLKWSHNNISISQNQGEAKTIDYVDLINNDGSEDVAYTFENLPVWFDVKSGANGAKGAVNTINARETNSNLVFETKSFLNPGVHSANIYIKTSNKQSGVKLGVESFRVEVVVTCPEPVVSQSFKNEYPFSMDFKGDLLIGGQRSLDINDAVTTYIGNTPRGYARVSSNGIVNLTVFGNADETSALTFKVWDASECTEYEGIVENYSFAFNTSQGTNAAPVIFTVGKKVKRRIPVVKGFQELSFNLKDNNTSNTLMLSAIKGLPVSSEILDITNPVNKAVVGVNGSFTGTLTEIDITKSYLVKVATDAVKYIEIVGVPVDLNTNLTISGGKVPNALPYYPNNLERTSYALRSFTATKVSEGDKIERRGLFAEYTASSGWRGSLTHLTPGLGYIFKSQNAGAINYSGIIKNAAARFAAKNTKVNNALSNSSSELEDTPSPKRLGLDFDENSFASFMYVNSVIDDVNLDVDKAYTILAFVNDELRGVSKAEFINEEFHYYIGIGGNISKNVQFKLYDGNTIFDLENIEVFSPDVTLGNLNNPYTFRMKAKEDTYVNNVLSLSQNFPNPMVNITRIQFVIPNDSFVELNIYNMIGQGLGTLKSGKYKKGNHSFTWDGVLNGQKLPQGTYVYDLITEGKRLNRKLVIIK